MARDASIHDVLALSVGQVNEQKLRRITAALREAFSASLSAHLVQDPILVRRKLAAQLRMDGASAGTVQALEQFFMGLVRRAALEGLISAPPEGPWSAGWQTVLASSSRLRSQIRMLAAWATDREIEPDMISLGDLEAWAAKSGCDKSIVEQLPGIIHAGQSRESRNRSSAALKERLQMKSARGTVRDSHG